MKDKNKIRQAFDMIRIPDGEPALGAVIGGEPIRQNTGRQIKVRRSGGIIAAAAAAVILASGAVMVYRIGRTGKADLITAKPGDPPTVVADNGDIRLTVSNIRCDGHLLLVHYDYEKLYSDSSDKRLENMINKRLHSWFSLNSKELGWSGWDETMIEVDNVVSDYNEVKNGDRIGVLYDYTESAEVEVKIIINGYGSDSERYDKVLDMTEDLNHKIVIEKNCDTANFKSAEGSLMTASELGIYGDAEAAMRFHDMFDFSEDARFTIVDDQGKEYDITETAGPHNVLSGGEVKKDYRIGFPIQLPVSYDRITEIKYGDMLYTRTDEHESAVSKKADPAPYDSAEINEVKKAVLESQLIQNQSFYDGLSDKMDNAAIYCCYTVDVPESLPVIDCIGSARRGQKKWYVLLEDGIEITLKETSDEFTVTGTSVPPKQNDQSADTRLSAAEILNLLNKFKDQAVTAVEIPLYQNTRLMLIGDTENSIGGLRAVLISGREDFCNMKLGEAIPFSDAVSRLKEGFPTTPAQEGQILYD